MSTMQGKVLEACRTLQNSASEADIDASIYKTEFQIVSTMGHLPNLLITFAQPCAAILQTRHGRE